MDSAMESTIEKIKLQEHGKEAKLREKRTIEATLASVTRNVRETMSRAIKIKEEFLEATAKADALDAELTSEQIRRCALAAQLEASSKELQQLKVESEHEISKVWKLRNFLCNEVQKASDQCDVWALLTKPKLKEKTATALKKCLNDESTKQVCEHEGMLENVQKRRQSLITERDRLLNEPDYGDEFLRKCLAYQGRIRQLSSAKVEANENEPIKFSTSPAARRTVTPVIRKTKNDMPWYQPYSVVASVAVFLIYFCILREENDVDTEFNKTLYERIHGLEKEQLLQSYRYNKENGKSVADIEQRLKEIEEESKVE